MQLLGFFFVSLFALFKSITTRTFPLRKSSPPETENKVGDKLDTNRTEGQQSVIRETAGRRKRRREVNRKLGKETTSLGETIQSDKGVEKLSEEKSDPKGPATVRVKETFCLGWERV